MPIARTFGSSLAFAALMVPHAAQAAEAQSCVTDRELVGMVEFVMPSVIEGVVEGCRDHVAPGGFLATSGQKMIDAYSVGKEAAWPEARAAFIKLGGDGKASLKLIDALPDDVMQPLVSFSFSRAIVDDLKPSDCGKVERLAEVFDRIGPKDTAELFGAIIQIAGPSSKKKQIQVCGDDAGDADTLPPPVPAPPPVRIAPPSA